MKPATALITTVGHPADRILAIVNKLQQEAIDRETAVRMQTREDVTAELQLKLEEARASITQLLEQARASASEWQQERTRLEEQIAVLNAVSQTGSNNQAEFQLKLEEVRASNAQHLEQAKASASEWQQERTRFEEQIAVLSALSQTGSNNQTELQVKLEEARASNAQLLEQAGASASEWQQQRTRFEEQIAVLNAVSQTGSNNQAELQLKLEEAQASNAQHLEQAKASASDWQQERARFEEQIAVLNARPEPAKNDQPAQGLSAQVAAIVAGEMARVQSLMDEIDGKLADTSLEMAAEMRLRRERAELEAYLKGLRYSQTKP